MYNTSLVITALLKAGADLQARDNAGHTAVDYAQQRSDTFNGGEALKLLQKASQETRSQTRPRLHGAVTVGGLSTNPLGFDAKRENREKENGKILGWSALILSFEFSSSRDRLYDGFQGGAEVRKHIVAMMALTVLLAASAYAQTENNIGYLASTGTLQQVQTAIDNGVDVNFRYVDGGQTPLMYAAHNNPNPKVFSALLKAGADLKARDDKERTVLIYASWSNNPDMIATVLKAGPNLKNAQDIFGMTALMYAAQRPDPQMIITLLKAGANAKVKDRSGKTALDWSKGNPALQGTDALKQLEAASK